MIDIYLLKGLYQLAPVELENVDKEVVFKICVPFTNCIDEISNPQIDSAKELM